MNFETSLPNQPLMISNDGFTIIDSVGNVIMERSYFPLYIDIALRGAFPNSRKDEYKHLIPGGTLTTGDVHNVECKLNHDTFPIRHELYEGHEAWDDDYPVDNDFPYFDFE